MRVLEVLLLCLVVFLITAFVCWCYILHQQDAQLEDRILHMNCKQLADYRSDINHDHLYMAEERYHWHCEINRGS